MPRMYYEDDNFSIKDLNVGDILVLDNMPFDKFDTAKNCFVHATGECRWDGWQWIPMYEDDYEDYEDEYER